MISTPSDGCLFAIDGSKTLRKAIDLMLGEKTRVQRCRNHKLCNVLGHRREGPARPG